MDNEQKKSFSAILKSLGELIVGNPGGGTLMKEDTTPEYTPVIKSEIKGDDRLFTAVVLRPDVVDAHGDIYSVDVVEKACHEYNEFCRDGNIQHMVQTDAVVPVESSIAKASYKLGEGEVLEGDWVMTVRVDNDQVWDMCKKGDFTGFSVGCHSLSESLVDEVPEVNTEKALGDWVKTLTPLKGE